METLFFLSFYLALIILTISTLCYQTFLDWKNKRGSFIDFVVFVVIDIITIIGFIVQFTN
jgi:hypothetical protein